MGVVEDNNAVRAALAAASAVPGVREIENRLVSAALFESASTVAERSK